MRHCPPSRITARAFDVPTNRELVRTAGDFAPGGDVRAAYDSVSLRLLRLAQCTDERVAITYQ